MIVYLVTSINRHGARITTRHFTPSGATYETLRRNLAGHAGITVQEAPATVNIPNHECTLIKRLPKGGRA